MKAAASFKPAGAARFKVAQMDRQVKVDRPARKPFSARKEANTNALESPWKKKKRTA